MDADIKLGQKIRDLRKSMGYTQEKLAELVDIDNKHLSKIENGLHLPTYKTLKKLSDVLHFSLEDNETMPTSKNSINNSPTYYKSLKILNSAKDEDQLKKYYSILKVASKLINNE